MDKFAVLQLKKKRAREEEAKAKGLQAREDMQTFYNPDRLAKYVVHQLERATKTLRNRHNRSEL